MIKSLANRLSRLESAKQSIDGCCWMTVIGPEVPSPEVCRHGRRPVGVIRVLYEDIGDRQLNPDAVRFTIDLDRASGRVGEAS